MIISDMKFPWWPSREHALSVQIVACNWLKSAMQRPNVVTLGFVFLEVSQSNNILFLLKPGKEEKIPD